MPQFSLMSPPNALKAQEVCVHYNNEIRKTRTLMSPPSVLNAREEEQVRSRQNVTYKGRTPMPQFALTSPPNS